MSQKLMCSKNPEHLILHLGAKFCSKCGAPVAVFETPTCTCGTSVYKGDNYCSGCGRLIDPLFPPEPEPQFLPIEVGRFVDREARKLGLTMMAVLNIYRTPGPIQMEDARDIINDIRKDQGLPALEDEVMTAANQS